MKQSNAQCWGRGNKLLFWWLEELWMTVITSRRRCRTPKFLNTMRERQSSFSLKTQQSTDLSICWNQPVCDTNFPVLDPEILLDISGFKVCIWSKDHGSSEEGKCETKDLVHDIFCCNISFFCLCFQSREVNCVEGNNDHIQPMDCCTCYTKPERRHILFFQDEKLEAIFPKIGNSFCKPMQFDSWYKSSHSQHGTSS